MDLKLKNTTVCISGGTKGLGRVTAIEFAREGARIVVTARGQEAIDSVVKELLDAGASDAFGVQTDAGDPESISNLFEQIESRWGELHTLINMVGPTEPSAGINFLEVPDEQWQHYWDVGVMSVVRCSRAAVPLMRKSGWGRIVNISSISSKIGMPFEAPYMTAKAGLNALSKNMAWALAKENILVNTIAPGPTATALFLDGKPQEAIDHIAKLAPLERLGTPDDIAAAVAFLAGRDGSWVNGQILRVNGGII